MRYGQYRGGNPSPGPDDQTTQIPPQGPLTQPTGRSRLRQEPVTAPFPAQQGQPGPGNAPPPANATPDGTGLPPEPGSRPKMPWFQHAVFHLFHHKKNGAYEKCRFRILLLISVTTIALGTFIANWPWKSKEPTPDTTPYPNSYGSGAPKFQSRDNDLPTQLATQLAAIEAGTMDWKKLGEERVAVERATVSERPQERTFDGGISI